MAVAALEGLLDAQAIEPLLAAAATLTPGIAIEVRDSFGTALVVHGEAAPGASRGRARIEVDDEPIGVVEVTGDGPPEALGAVASTVAAALSLVAGEAASRRAVTAAALDDLRELSLLKQLAETVGTAVDPEQIAGRVLEAIADPLRAEVALVLPAEPAGDGGIPRPVAALGSTDDVARLALDSTTLVDRLRAEDPDQGLCADLARPAFPDAFGSILAAVVRTTRGTQGALVLGRRPGSRPFDDVDRRLVAAVASQTAIALERAALQREILGRRRIDDELAIGRRIQRSLMPRRFPNLPGWEIAAVYESAREIGGDFYDAFPLRGQPGKLAFAVADVTGKGIPAAILMADARALIHAAADHATDPADSLGRVNRVLVEERATSLFVTVAHGVVDGPSGELVIASAGHDPVHILRRDGDLTIIEPTGRLIGMSADIAAHSVHEVVEPGDAIVAHTDGVTEARSPDGGFYGEDRYRAVLAGLAGRSASAIVDGVMADLAVFRSGAEAFDDLTLLVLRRLPDADPGAA